MCEFCIKHGEGKKWYEVSQNYSKELMNQGNREEFTKQFFLDSGRNIASMYGRADRAKIRMPSAYRLIRMIGTSWLKKYHFGQVLPLEDAEMTVDLAQCITRIPCMCRAATRGRRNARYCLLYNFDPIKILGDFSEVRASLEVLTPLRAKELLREFDQEGLVHSIWTFKTPFIGGICNCDQDCMAYKVQVATDLVQIMFKAEYVAEIDQVQCVGCRGCLKFCQFGAVQYSALNNKCSVNPLKCYGCGVCRRACQKDAVTLIDRARIPGEGVW